MTARESASFAANLVAISVLGVVYVAGLTALTLASWVGQAVTAIGTLSNRARAREDLRR